MNTFLPFSGVTVTLTENEEQRQCSGLTSQTDCTHAFGTNTLRIISQEPKT